MAAVCRSGDWSLQSVAPEDGFEPSFSVPKTDVLPLDDSGISAIG